jgi:hypothetical protein
MSISLKGTVSTPDRQSIAGASVRVSASNQASGEIQIDEAGFQGANRAQRVHNDLQKWVARNARGYTQWGLMASDDDIGDGDRTFGMDHAFHGGDWQNPVDTYRYWASQIQSHEV